MTAQVHNRITIEADKMDGQPCIRGLRFPVVTMLRMVAAGMSPMELKRGIDKAVAIVCAGQTCLPPTSDPTTFEVDSGVTATISGNN